jgi:hypothetical protein
VVGLQRRELPEGGVGPVEAAGLRFLAHQGPHRHLVGRQQPEDGVQLRLRQRDVVVEVVPLEPDPAAFGGPGGGHADQQQIVEGDAGDLFENALDVDRIGLPGELGGQVVPEALVAGKQRPEVVVGVEVLVTGDLQRQVGGVAAPQPAVAVALDPEPIGHAEHREDERVGTLVVGPGRGARWRDEQGGLDHSEQDLGGEQPRPVPDQVLDLGAHRLAEHVAGGLQLEVDVQGAVVLQPGQPDRRLHDEVLVGGRLEPLVQLSIGERPPEHLGAGQVGRHGVDRCRPGNRRGRHDQPRGRLGGQDDPKPWDGRPRPHKAALLEASEVGASELGWFLAGQIMLEPLDLALGIDGGRRGHAEQCADMARGRPTSSACPAAIR